MAKIVGPPKGKRVECDSCDSTIEYLPEDVQEHHGTDSGGGPDGYERVKCPRPRCPGHGYIRIW
jgi:hypothetical protein